MANILVVTNNVTNNLDLYIKLEFSTFFCRSVFLEICSKVTVSTINLKLDLFECFSFYLPLKGVNKCYLRPCFGC